MSIAAAKSNPKRGATRFVATNENLKRLVERTKDRHTLAQIADELGISDGYLSALLSGRDRVSRTIDRAAEGLLRRFVKLDDKAPRLIIARVALPHWPTISLLVKNLGGKVHEEFHALLTDDKNIAPEVIVVVFTLDSAHEVAVVQLIKTTGGEVRGVLP